MKASEQPWDKSLQLLLVLIVGFNLLPHTMDIPPWVTAASVAALVWKVLSLIRGWILPKKWHLAGLTFAGTAAVFTEYRTLLGQEAASTLLVYLASLKLLETSRYRDAMLVILTSYFLLMAHLLNSQSLLSTVYMGLDVLLITALMFHLHKKDRRTSPRSFRPAMKILALTLPVWTLLFVAFPRFSTTFWRLQTSPPASTGFTDDLDPGTIEQMVESDEPAFRVNFAGNEILAPDVLYWRGGILTVSDGLKWTKPSQLTRTKTENLVTPDSSARPFYSYEIFLEPTFKKWIFTLDYPRDVTTGDPYLSSQIRKRPGFIYESARDIGSRIVYAGVSTMHAPLQELGDDERKTYLQVPDDLAPRVQSLAETLRSGSNDARGASRNILRYFSERKFGYTRRPGALPADKNQLETFLFETRRGFCEHFAASFATLMRAMGHPARVAIGFQGGKYNQYGSYLMVRSMDAHAWAEIWEEDTARPGSGRWVRIDPTQVIAPLRLQMGGDYNRLDPNALADGVSGEDLRRNLDRGWLQLGFKLSMAWDAAQMTWNGFLLRYDFDYQKALMERLGVKNASRWIFFIWVGLGVLVFISILHWSLRRKATREDPLLITWRKFCLEMERAGISRSATEGPHAFAERAAALRPDHAEDIRKIAREFAELRYGRETAQGPNPATLKSFRQSVRRFSIAPSSRSVDS